MIHSAGLDKKFWAEALQTEVHVCNRGTSRSLPTGKTPYHLWMKTVPYLGYLRIFRSDCFYTIPKTKVQKLDPRASRAIFMGYSTQSKGYKLWDSKSRKMIVSRDVTFRESTEVEYEIPVSSPELKEDINRGGGRKVRFDVSSSENDSTSADTDANDNANKDEVPDRSGDDEVESSHENEIEVQSDGDEIENSSDADYVDAETDTTLEKPSGSKCQSATSK